MRIISGHKRGLKLTPLGSGDETARLRPTTDRVRESLFNILQNGTYGEVLVGSPDALRGIAPETGEILWENPNLSGISSEALTPPGVTSVVESVPLL